MFVGIDYFNCERKVACFELNFNICDDYKIKKTLFTFAKPKTSCGHFAKWKPTFLVE